MSYVVSMHRVGLSLKKLNVINEATVLDKKSPTHIVSESRAGTLSVPERQAENEEGL